MAKIVKIENLSEDLGKRFFAEEQLQADPALVAEGWERRFTTAIQRAQEVTGLYTQLGYEVRAEPVQSEELSGHCEDCHSAISTRIVTIYTRPKRR